ncbi:MAG: GNAT family N-acetyltransferase [Bacteroidia bacterium]|nr:GNAT family N-acetyltransferase [Bacteroidia bacterium]
MKIFTATTDHLPALAPLFDAYRTFYRRGSDMEAARTFLEERITRQESVVFLAMSDNVGAGFTQLYPLFSSLGMKRRWLLNDLYVAPEFRNMGVATLLLECAREWGMATGANALILETEVTNVGAQRLYEKTGWKRDIGNFSYYLEL